MKTIARTATRKIAAIAATVTAVKVYDQSVGDFRPSTIDAAFTTLRNNKNARLVDMENGTYNVNVHSNWWYVLTTGPVAEPKPTPVAGPGSLATASARTTEGVRAVRTARAATAEAASAPVDPADAEAVEKLGRSKYAVHRAALLTIAEKTGKFRNGVVPAGSSRFVVEDRPGGTFALVDARHSLGSRTREIRLSTGEPARWTTSDDAGQVALLLARAEDEGERSPSDGLVYWSKLPMPFRPVPYVTYAESDGFGVRDVRYPETASAGRVVVTMTGGKPARWDRRDAALKACAELWEAELAGRRMQGDEWF